MRSLPVVICGNYVLYAVFGDLNFGRDVACQPTTAVAA
jgi:hypothetical protein